MHKNRVQMNNSLTLARNGACFVRMNQVAVNRSKSYENSLEDSVTMYNCVNSGINVQRVRIYPHVMAFARPMCMENIEDRL